mgnify:CR=1 FL=1
MVAGVAIEEHEFRKESVPAARGIAEDVHKSGDRDRLTQEALADVDAGLVVDPLAVQAWADSLGTDQPLPLPLPR